jgi:5-formyltetrahydrofolate cyclo-ligase
MGELLPARSSSARAGPSVADVLREAISTQRSRRPAEDRDHSARGLRDVFVDLSWTRRMRYVALYAPADDGARGIRFVRAALLARGVVVLTPSPQDDRHGDDAPLADRDPALSGPETLAVLALADLVLVPALAVDTLGHRLGCHG